jgi:hypothetical protein
MDDVHQEGYDAFNKGLTLADNPHKEDGEKRKSWEAGWEDAKIDADLQRRSICGENRT